MGGLDNSSRVWGGLDNALSVPVWVDSRVGRARGGWSTSPLMSKLPGGGYIDNDDIHTWENNVIGEGVYRPPPRVEVIRIEEKKKKIEFSYFFLNVTFAYMNIHT